MAAFFEETWPNFNILYVILLIHVDKRIDKLCPTLLKENIFYRIVELKLVMMKIRYSWQVLFRKFRRKVSKKKYIYIILLPPTPWYKGKNEATYFSIIYIRLVSKNIEITIFWSKSLSNFKSFYFNFII